MKLTKLTEIQHNINYLSTIDSNSELVISINKSTGLTIGDFENIHYNSSFSFLKQIPKKSPEWFLFSHSKIITWLKTTHLLYISKNWTKETIEDEIEWIKGNFDLKKLWLSISDIEFEKLPYN